MTTPKGRWLVPPDRAVWVPARSEHAIDVLADIEMRTLYFDLAWLRREERGLSLDAEFVVRVSRLLHETILALFDGRDDPDRTCLVVRLALLELHQAEISATFIPLPHGPRCRRAANIVLADPDGSHESIRCARGRTSARTLSRLFSSETQLSFKKPVPARPHRGGDRKAVDGNLRLGQTTRRRPWLCERPCVFARFPAGHLAM